MAVATVAPWAQTAPGVARTMTAQELARLPDDGWLYELVEGRLVRMPPPGSKHGRIVMELGAELRNHVRSNRRGRVFGAETGFQFSRAGQPDTVLGADVSYVEEARLPPLDDPAWDRYLALAPDLVAELASPSQYRPELAAKAGIWLAAGVRLLWVVWPAAQQVDVWLPGSVAPVARLTEEDALDGRDIVPGFSYSLRDLFR